MDKTKASYEKNGLFASKQFIGGRLTLSMIVLIATIALGAAAWWPCLIFAGLAISVVLQSGVNARWHKRTKHNKVWLELARSILSLVDTSLYALSVTLIQMNHTQISTEFALIILMITVLYSSMYFYMQPRLLAVLMIPCVLSLGVSSADEAYRAAVHGRMVVAMVPVLGGALAIYFISQTRKQLAVARFKLERARSKAQQSADDAYSASQAKSDFLATMGHEIRTPLNGVLGVAQIMARDPLSELQRERLEVISRSGESLLGILNDLMDFSKIEAGRWDLEPTAFDLNDLVKGAHGMFTAAAELKDIGFDLVLAPQACGLYYGDSARLRQILHNLLSNAVKFTDRGRVQVRVDYVGAELIIEVTDSGIGVPADRLGALCEKFVQADASTTRRYGGTGLGLAIVSQLLNMMKGRLEVQSEVGAGSTFTATVPMPRLERSAPAAAPAPVAVDDEGDLQPIRILAAEDNPVNQMVLRAMLQPTGADLLIVEDGEKAVAAWSEGDYDLILMDIQMPQMDGRLATLTIRRLEREQGRRRTPIIALSANAMAHQRIDYLSDGMDDLVAKPIQIERLYAVIHSLLTPAEVQAHAGETLRPAA